MSLHNDAVVVLVTLERSSAATPGVQRHEILNSRPHVAEQAQILSIDLNEPGIAASNGRSERKNCPVVCLFTQRYSTLGIGRAGISLTTVIGRTRRRNDASRSDNGSTTDRYIRRIIAPGTYECIILDGDPSGSSEVRD